MTKTDTQLFIPWRKEIAQSRYDVLDELSRPIGGFKIPLGLKDRARIALNRVFNTSDIFKDSFVVSEYENIRSWGLLLGFLHKNGILEQPHFLPEYFFNDEPKYAATRLEAAFDGSKTDGINVSVRSFGAAISFDEAAGKAVGEIMERYFLTIYDNKKLMRDSPLSMKQKGEFFLDPKSMNTFSTKQKEGKPVLNYSDNADLSWVKGKELLSGSNAYMPAQTVFWSYDTGKAGEVMLVNKTTNGGGGHFTRTKAILSSIYENIERDGFLIYWLNSIPPNVIDKKSILDEEVADFLRYVEQRYGLKVFLLNTTSDIKVPSLTCVIVDERDEDVRISVGAGTNFSFREAFFSAVFEALSVLRFKRRSEKFELPGNYKPFGGKPEIGRTERLLLWQGKKMYDEFKFFISGESQSVSSFIGNSPKFKNEGEELSYVLDLFRTKGAGYEIYCYEAKDHVLEKIGYHVVRTVIPQLVPLYLYEHLATLEARRLREVPTKIGRAAAKILNPWPHPFP